MRVVIARQAGVLRDRLRQAVLGLGLECKSGDCVSYEDLPKRLAKNQVDLVLIGLGSDLSQGLAVLEKAYEQTEAPIFAVGLSSDSEQILKAIRSGAREHLHEEDVREELLYAIRKLQQAGVTAPRWGKVLGVTGAQAGLGVTTVACNLAFALGGYYPGQVVVGELGNCVPQMALNLDLQPRHGLDELAASWDRMDSVLMRKALVTHPSHVSVLAYPPDTLQPVTMSESIIRNMLVLLRSMFNFTIADLGHQLDDSRLEALTMADKIVVVVRLDVPSLRLSRQFIQRLEDVGVGQEKLCIIVNRFGQRKQFSWRKAKEVLGLTISEWIPDDPGTVNLSINHGQPLIKIAKRASITRRFSNLAKQLNGRASKVNGK